MFVYEKKLQYPVKIKRTNPKLAAQIISQYGGPECKRVQLTECCIQSLILSRYSIIRDIRF